MMKRCFVSEKQTPACSLWGKWLRAGGHSLILGSALVFPVHPLCAQALPATITWTGNSFGGAAYTTAAGASELKHVQLQVDDMAVDTDGTVYTDSIWDEDGGEANIYKNDDVIGKCQDVSHGWGRGGGLAVAVDASYVYTATTQNGDDGADTALNSNGLRRYPDPGTTWFCVRRFHKDGSSAPFPRGYGIWNDTMIVNQIAKGATGYPNGYIPGLAVSGGSLYVSDPYHNRIAVYDAAQLSGTPSLSWTVTAPGKIVFDGSQKLWVLQSGSTPVLVCYSASGQLQSQQITFAATMTPSAIAWNAASSRLLVADKGVDQNIKLYDPAGLSGTPTAPASTFGTAGGIHSGTDGQTGPLRFFDPVGVGADAAGNLYVANSTGVRGGALSLESYTSTGGANWASPLQCLEFVNCADTDPLSDTDIYSNDKHYKFDYSRPAGKGWTFAGLTVNRFKYPDDPRQHADFSGGTWVRRINGVTYLFLTQQQGGDIGVVRLSPSTDGETAVPYAFVTDGYASPDASGWPAGQPGTASSSTEWIWRDANGNGKIDTGEYVSPAAGSPAQLHGAGWGEWVDQAGDIWQCGGGHIRHFKMHLDGSGRPAWDYAARNIKVLSPPALPNGATWQHGANPDNDDMDRLEYQPGTDTMYISGFTTAYPDDSGAWGGAGRVVYRYDHWNGARTIHAGYPVQLSWGTKGSMAVKSISVEGAYLFAVQAGDPETVTVYALDTGAKVGTMAPDASISSRSGWVDIKFGLRAHKRANGEYIIFAEEDLNEKALMYRWTPLNTSRSGRQPHRSSADKQNHGKPDRRRPRRLDLLGRRQPDPQVRRQLADQRLHPRRRGREYLFQ